MAVLLRVSGLFLVLWMLLLTRSPAMSSAYAPEADGDYSSALQPAIGAASGMAIPTSEHFTITSLPIEARMEVGGELVTGSAPTQDASVEGLSSSLDLVAVRAYLKDQSGNEVTGNPSVGQVVYFHFDWRCDGSGTTPIYLIQARLNGS